MYKKIKIPGRHPVQIYGSGVLINIPGDEAVEIVTSSGPSDSGILLETGDYLLLETGDYFLMEA